ncbi:hypothetical protein D9758_016566 [Tetrapyrgos nigripes]|uniref:DUF6533 domain-containing protein n=1 Tax=Tetrapyrgos nigripes TaxID=182062 RepID=A0A8H5BZB8_9AGAR|nr:hypothetical protein D9758_016566 [Tetrapyrgos nigripes]
MDQGSNPGVDVGIEGQIRFHRYMYLLGISTSFLAFIYVCGAGAGVVILFWNHIITFGDEINYIWARPKILSSYCFLLIRYLALFGAIPVTVMKFSTMSISMHAIPFLLEHLDHFENYGYERRTQQNP